MVGFRLTGSRGDADAVWCAADGIEHMEQVGDWATGMRDDPGCSESPSDAVHHVSQRPCRFGAWQCRRGFERA
jgi:hypothetical protein